MELHTISPDAGYTQEDVIALSYVMAGWEHRYSKKRSECNPVHFNAEHHEPGTHVVLGKSYKQRGLDASNKLMDAIEDLCAHPQCRQFIATKLCRHFICDEPTEAMTAPIVAAWEQTDGHLPAVHKALLQVAWDHTGIEKKFHNPEVWLLQMVKMGGVAWPPSPKSMTYSFKNRVTQTQARKNDAGNRPVTLSAATTKRVFRHVIGLAIARIADPAAGIRLGIWRPVAKGY